MFLKNLCEKYGQDFNWFEPLNKSILETQLSNELIPEHPLFGINLFVIAKNERNDDVLFFDRRDYYLIHLTWTKGTKIYPKYKKISIDFIQTVLEDDYLYN